MRIGKMVIVLSCVVLFFSSCSSKKLISQPADSTDSNPSAENNAIVRTGISEEIYDFKRLNTDSGYKMFYGKWLATKKIAENYRLDSQDVSDVIDKEFIFNNWQSFFTYQSEEVKIYYPEYEITIIPLDETTDYFPYMPAFTELGFAGDYITIFSIRGDSRGCDVYFVLKDDETLIMFYRDAYIELKRMEHIEGYNSFYHAL